jgi:hypothetical protein
MEKIQRTAGQDLNKHQDEKKGQDMYVILNMLCTESDSIKCTLLCVQNSKISGTICTKTFVDVLIDGRESPDVTSSGDFGSLTRARGPPLRQAILVPD